MKTEIKNLRKSLILETASRHFREFGYEKTQIEKIAKELSVGVGTIYSIFGSKEGIFASHIYSVIEKSFEEIKELVKNVKSPLEKIKIFVEYKFNYYDENKSIMRDHMKNNPFFIRDTRRGDKNPMKEIYLYLSVDIKEFLSQPDINKKHLISDDYYHHALLLDSIVNSIIERFCDEDTKLIKKTPLALNMFTNTLGI